MEISMDQETVVTAVWEAQSRAAEAKALCKAAVHGGPELDPAQMDDLLAEVRQALELAMERLGTPNPNL